VAVICSGGSGVKNGNRGPNIRHAHYHVTQKCIVVMRWTHQHAPTWTASFRAMQLDRKLAVAVGHHVWENGQDLIVVSNATGDVRIGIAICPCLWSPEGFIWLECCTSSRALLSALITPAL
jgi:hypothetical protein